MTTAVDTAPDTSTSAPAAPPVSTLEDLTSVFYGTGAVKDADPSKETAAPIAHSETGPSASSDKTTADSTETAKKDEAPKGTDAEKDPAKEQLASQRAANGRLGKELQELKTQVSAIVQENQTLKAKLDGTYKDPPQPTPEQVLELAEFKGREQASRTVAVQLFGEDAVQKVYGEESDFAALVISEVKANKEKFPSHSFLEVRAHPQPTVKALHILHRTAFEKQYGEDPLKWREQIEAEVRPKILDEFKKQAATPVTGSPPPTVSEARGAAGGPKKTKSDEEIFYGKGAA